MYVFSVFCGFIIHFIVKRRNTEEASDMNDGNLSLVHETGVDRYLYNIYTFILAYEISFSNVLKCQQEQHYLLY